MSAIRVVRLIARTNVGGPALQVVGLAQGLDAAGFEQRLLAGSVGRGEADYFDVQSSDVEIVRIPGLGRAPRPWDDARALTAVVREIRRFRPHIVHTHTAKAGALGRVAARLSRVPATVHTFHGHLLTGYFSPLKTRAVVRVERLLARRTTRLVTVGARVRDELLAAGIGRPQQYAVIPPGVYPLAAPLRGDARRELGLCADEPVVAFVARLTAVKRPDRLAEVVYRVVDRRPDARIVIAGEGDRLPDLRARTATLGDRVHFLGWRADVATVYAASDVVLLTSDNEGMPVSLIEAAMVGRAAVTTDVGSAAEVVLDGVTGFVTSTSSKELAAAVCRLLGDRRLRERLGAAAFRRAESKFSAERLVADIERLYEEVAAEVRVA